MGSVSKPAIGAGHLRSTMSNSPSAHEMREQSERPRKAGFMAWLGLFAVLGLVIPEILSMGLALVWSLAGLLDLGQTLKIVLAVIIAVPALWMSYIVIRLAYESEILRNE